MELRRAVTPWARLALAAGSSARWASRVTGRGAGAMIGGLVAMTLDRSILRQLGVGRRTVVVTGTNGKSTTTRMTAAALATMGPVASNSEGANMDAGLVAALAADRHGTLAALEVDEMHVPHVLDAIEAAVVIFLNLSRDQLDRVGEINVIERTLRGGLARHPKAVVVANCDDVLMTSAAYDAPHVVWVAAGGAWANDSVSCPRSGEVIVRDKGHWYSTGTDFKRPSPHWWFDPEDGGTLYGPDGLALPMRLALPGAVNRGNAAQAVAAAVALGADPAKAVAAVSAVDEVAGRYRTVRIGQHEARILLAKNPAGWQEALSMVDEDAAGVVIAVNGQVPDGEDLSWLWDVHFEHFGEAFSKTPVVAAGERGTDLAVRLGYAGVEHTLQHDTMAAIASCPPGQVEVVANYTAFLQLQRKLARHG